jgi:hypothetical protein
MNRILIAVGLLGITSVAAYGQLNAGGRIVSAADLAEARVGTRATLARDQIAPRSGMLRFLLSPAGAELARAHPNLRGMLPRTGATAGTGTHRARTRRPPVVSWRPPVPQPCNNFATGTKFNLEPDAGMSEIGFPVTQDTESVDFIPSGGLGGADLVIGGTDDFRGLWEANATFDGVENVVDAFGWGYSGTGYHVSRRGGCSADFEGGLPRIFDSVTQQDLFGLGNPSVAVDATRGNVFASDLRGNQFVTSVTLFRTNAVRLNSERDCPSGTHLTDKNGNDTTARTCWPVGVLVAPSSNFHTINDREHVRADERAAGAGAGDVYVSWSRTQVGDRTTSILLVACKGEFKSAKDCSDPIAVSGADPFAAFADLVILPNGAISLTYAQVNEVFDTSLVPFFFVSYDIKHVTCKPLGAPLAPKCSEPTAIATEKQPPFRAITNSRFDGIAAIPTHDVRRNRDGGLEEIVVWTRCKRSPFLPLGSGQFLEETGCPDADVVFTSARLEANGTPRKWGAVRVVNDHVGDQIFPRVAVDRQTGEAHVAYYSSENDPVHHRLQLMVSTLRPDAEEMRPPKIRQSTLNEPDADVIVGAFFFGDYLGIASRDGRTYTHSTFNNFGIYGNSVIPGQDNVLTRSQRWQDED